MVETGAKQAGQVEVLKDGARVARKRLVADVGGHGLASRDDKQRQKKLPPWSMLDSEQPFAATGPNVSSAGRFCRSLPVHSQCLICEAIRREGGFRNFTARRVNGWNFAS